MSTHKFKKGKKPPRKAAPLFFNPKHQELRQDNELVQTSLSGQELELVIDDVIPGGQAMCKFDGRTVFLDMGSPGQRVLAKIEGIVKGVTVGRRLKVLDPAPGEVKPFCEYFGICGGCLWQEMSYSEQLKLKSAHIKQTVDRIAGLKNIEFLPIIASPETKHFRAKVEFAFAAIDGPYKKRSNLVELGFRERASHKIVPITSCPVGSPHVGIVLDTVRMWLPQSRLSAWEKNGDLGIEQAKVLRFFNMRESAITGRLALELITAPAPFAAKAIRQLGEMLMELDVVQSFAHSVRESEDNIAQGEAQVFTLGEPLLREYLNGIQYDLSPEAFFQTNIGVAKLLQEKVLALAEQAHAEQGVDLVWDAYCGVGALALPLAQRFKNVCGFEISSVAVENAKHNAELNSINNCKFLAGDVRELMRSYPGDPNLLVLDPPRGGLDREVVKTLLIKKISYLIYVSCNPSTLARDLKLLSEKYTPLHIQPLDMFPHTPHVEAICFLKRS